MGAKDAKQFVYRYNGDLKSEEIEQDLDGEIAVPQKDQIIQRNGKSWKVVFVNTEFSLSQSGPIPVVRVFLIEQP
jgi:hypothetical protein